MTVANGVVYGESMAGTATAPTMFALNASTGHTLWSFAAGSSVISGATIVNDTVYWGSGYAHSGYTWLHREQQVLRLLGERTLNSGDRT